MKFFKELKTFWIRLRCHVSVTVRAVGWSFPLAFLATVTLLGYLILSDSGYSPDSFSEGRAFSNLTFEVLLFSPWATLIFFVGFFFLVGGFIFLSDLFRKRFFRRSKRRASLWLKVSDFGLLIASLIYWFLLSFNLVEFITSGGNCRDCGIIPIFIFYFLPFITGLVFVVSSVVFVLNYFLFAFLKNKLTNRGLKN